MRLPTKRFACDVPKVNQPKARALAVARVTEPSGRLLLVNPLPSCERDGLLSVCAAGHHARRSFFFFGASLTVASSVAAAPTQPNHLSAVRHVGRSARCTRAREGLLDLHRLHQVGRRRRQGHRRPQRPRPRAGGEKGAAPSFTQCAHCLRCRASRPVSCIWLGARSAAQLRSPLERCREPYALRAT